MAVKEVDWNEAPLQRWLNPIVNKGTKQSYVSAYKAYSQFTQMSAVDLIREAYEDAQKSPLEKKDVVITKMIKDQDMFTHIR